MTLKLRPTTYVLKLQASTPYPDTGRLVCIGYMLLGGDKVHVEAVEGPRSERRVLRDLERLLKSCHIYITWDGANLEVPYLTATMLRHMLDPAPLYSARHIDLAKIVSSQLRLSGTGIQEACRFFRIPVDPLLKMSMRRHEGRGREKGERGAARESLALCRAQVVAIEKLSRRLLPLISALNPDLPTLL
ncbi:MAG: hypothetical protein QXO86_00670 [Nitrososphaerota archaeon]